MTASGVIASVNGSIATNCDGFGKRLRIRLSTLPFTGGKRMDRRYCTYIMASKRNGTLYIGVTNDIVRRTWEHREGLIPGFTKKYGVKTLVYFEQFEDIRAAINRETRLKFYRRSWKIRLIESMNPEWRDLYDLVTAR